MLDRDFGNLAAILRMCDDICSYREEGMTTAQMLDDRKTYNAILLNRKNRRSTMGTVALDITIHLPKIG